MIPYTHGLRWMSRAVILLVVATVGLLVWHHFGMHRVLELGPASTYPVATVSDHGEGGVSTVTLARERDGIVLHCQLRKATYQWPYCGLHFRLGDGEQGVDLSGFDRMTLSVTDDAPGSHGVRVYFRNFETGFSTADDWQSQKVNEIEVAIPPGGDVVVPLDLLRTAAWWVSDRNVPLLRTGVRIDNTTAIELYTGSHAATGSHRLTLRSLRLEGKWISQNTLLLGIVAAWSVLGVMWPILQLLDSRAQLRSSRARIAALKVVNRALELETQELAEQASLDPLTGALNRHGMREWLLNDENIGATGMALIVVDLDHFKRINDGHGHVTGDEVLQRFVGEMQARLRANQRLVRWGGEEFLILCRDLPLDSAARVAERLRVALATIDWPGGLQVTASFGVTFLAKGEDISEALRRADEALYIAKAGGRNRVECAPAAQG